MTDNATDSTKQGPVLRTALFLMGRNNDAKPLAIPKKAGYTATLVACGWAGAMLEKVTKASG